MDLRAQEGQKSSFLKIRKFWIGSSIYPGHIIGKFTTTNQNSQWKRLVPCRHTTVSWSYFCGPNFVVFTPFEALRDFLFRLILVWKKYPWLHSSINDPQHPRMCFLLCTKKRQKGRFLRSVQKDSVVFFPRSTMIFTRFSGFPTWIRKDILVFICLLQGDCWQLWWISLTRHNIKMSWNVYIIYITIYLTTQTLHHTKIHKSLKITINNKK